MTSDRLTQLDRWAFPTEIPTDLDDGRVLDAMEAFVSERPDGLATLVARYSTSTVEMVLRSLSFLLAQRAPHVDERSSNLVHQFVGSVSTTNDASTLMNALTAIQRQAMYDLPWSPTSAPPQGLRAFVSRCLGMNELVRSTTLRMLGALDAGGFLEALYAGAELEAIRTQLRDT
jgi:hypothetical protein